MGGWVEGGKWLEQLTFFPLPCDEGVKYNRKGLPQLPGDAGTARILPQGPDGSSEGPHSHPTTQPQGL